MKLQKTCNESSKKCNEKEVKLWERKRKNTINRFLAKVKN